MEKGYFIDTLFDLINESDEFEALFNDNIKENGDNSDNEVVSAPEKENKENLKTED